MHTPSLPVRLTTLASSLLTSGICCAATNIVNSCSDDPTLGGTLRNTIASSAPGDIVDLTHLDTSCSVITLATGSAPITVNQAAGSSGIGLTIQGPGADKLAISGGYGNRVLTHTGSGLLMIDGLTIEKGTVYGPYTTSPQKGGCIASYSYLYLKNSTVTHCQVVSSGTTSAEGGAIFGDSISLYRTTITESSAGPAPGATGYARGGGIAAFSNLSMNRSTISHDTALGPSGKGGTGGGIYSTGGSLVALNCTISNNAGSEAVASNVGGSANMFLVASTFSNNQNSAVHMNSDGRFVLVNSTISDNGAWGLFIDQSATGTASIYNSTIAFNGSGLYLGQNGTAKLQSTIISNPSTLDLDVISKITLSGSNNLARTTNLSAFPPGLLSTTADPKLGPLQNNGGATLTRLPSSGSPAIGAGNNIAATDYDQRGLNFPRTTGTSHSVDIGAVQFDTIFANDFEQEP